MVNKHFVHLCIVIFSLFYLCGHAQEFLPELKENTTLTIADYEAAFMKWSEDKDLDVEKGWKWHARWLEEQIRRSSSQGRLPDYNQLFSSAMEISALKNNVVNRSRGAFVPVGPRDFPRVPGGYLFHGMGRINTVEFHPSDSLTFWVGVAQGGVWKTNDGGKSWQPLTDDLPIIRISDIAADPSNPDILYAAIGDYAYVGVALDTDGRKRNTHYGLGVYKSMDGGMSWLPTGLTFDQLDGDASLIRRVFVHPIDGDKLVAAGISGVYTSDDGGQSWEKKLDEVMADIERHPRNPDILYASSHNVDDLGIGRPGIWKSVDGGANWIELNSGITSDDAQRIELAIAPSAPDTVYAIVCNDNGGFFGLFRTTDAGESWSLRSDNPNVLHWYVGNNRSGQGLYDLAIVVNAEDPDIIYTGGINMWGSEDGGLTWKRGSHWLPDLGASLHADHHYYDYNPLDNHYYICHDGGIHRTDEIDLFTVEETNEFGFEFSTEWEDLSAGMEISSFYRLDVSPLVADHIIAGAQDNSTFVMRDTTWYNVVLGDGMDCLFHPANPDIVYASTQGGRLTRSMDGGINFNGSLTNPILETGAWTTPFEADPADPDGLYTAFGNVYHSLDRGETWEQLTDVPSLPGSQWIIPASTLTISPSNPNRFYYAQRIYPTLGVNGKLWTSPDHGETVLNITSGLPDSLFITASAVSDISDETVWVTFGGFAEGLKVFRSDDAGTTWNNESLNLPNIPVNAIEFLPGSLNNEIYIGTDVGVYVKNDLMTEWELYSDGLPNVIITDIEIDTDQNELYVSTFGRGIWKSDLAILSNTTDQDIPIVQMEIFPNPGNGTFYIEFNHTGLTGELNLEVFDVRGRLVSNRSIESGGSDHIQLELSPGLYFVRLRSDIGSTVRRLIIE